MKERRAQFRFYEELNDFLPLKMRKKIFQYEFEGSPSIKDAIEAIGVPHTEVDLIIVNGRSVDFNYHLQNMDFVSVYPVFESLDISPITHLRPEPLRRTRFILDTQLGKLARLLRMLGLDTLYKNDYDDNQIIEISLSEKRIILTRDRGILKNKKVTRGYWVRSTRAEEQIVEILNRFDLHTQIRPFTRCLKCNGIIKRVNKQDIICHIPKMTGNYYEQFYRCERCKKIYWKGPHYKRMNKKIEELMRKADLSPNELHLSGNFL